MKTSGILSGVIVSVALLSAGCASNSGGESNSAIVSVKTLDGSSADSAASSYSSSTDRPPHVEADINPANSPVVRGPDGRPLGSLDTMEKLRRSRAR